MKDIWVFDMDETLVYRDPEFAEDYEDIEHLLPIRRMLFLFNFLKCINRKVMIMTNRHPFLRRSISNKFNVPVICRNYCLGKENIKKLSDNVALETFLFNMTLDKMHNLKALSDEYDLVYFFDDKIDSEWFFPENVITFRPPLKIKEILKLFLMIFLHKI